MNPVSNDLEDVLDASSVIALNVLKLDVEVNILRGYLEVSTILLALNMPL